MAFTARSGEASRIPLCPCPSGLAWRPHGTMPPVSLNSGEAQPHAYPSGIPDGPAERQSPTHSESPAPEVASLTDREVLQFWSAAQSTSTTMKPVRCLSPSVTVS